MNNPTIFYSAYLQDIVDKPPHLSLTQIADRMNFTTLSYFGRYVKKHLGVTPSQYRESGSPKMG